jgi:hypothetical protein
MLALGWKDQRVPDFNGLICASGEIYAIDHQKIIETDAKPKLDDWLEVAILAQMELFGGRYIVKCGEASAHGSIGFIVLEEKESQDPIWSFVSETSNPFDQIEIKAGYVLVLSTSGAVFRFRAPLKDVTLLNP